MYVNVYLSIYHIMYILYLHVIYFSETLHINKINIQKKFTTWKQLSSGDLVLKNPK